MAVACGFLLRVLGANGAALDWPQFRGPDGQGISTATNIPVHWSTTSNVVWKTEVPLQGWSSPVVSEGKIYLTSAVEGSTPNQISLRVLCFDAAGGKPVWNVEALQAAASDARKIHSKNSAASPTPVVSNGRIFVHFGHMGTAALDLSGNVIWRQTTLKYPPVHGNGGSPALVEGLLVFSCDGAENPFLAALDATTGQVRWRTPRNTPARSKFSFSTPLLIEVDGQKEIISPASGFVGGYNPQTGAELWRVRYGEGYSVVPRPVFAHGLLFVSSSFDRPVVYAIRPNGAKGDATATHIVWSHPKGAPNTPSMLIAGDELYFVSDSGIATCLDARTGKVHWSERLGGDFSASPVFAEGRVYFQNEGGAGFVVQAGKEFQLLAKNDLGERSLASAAVVDNALILRTASHLWRLGK